MRVALAFVFIITLAETYGQEKLNEFMTETSPEERARFQTEYMKDNLSLTDDQEKKVHDINLKYAEKIQEAYEAPTRRSQKLKAMQRINAEKEGDLKLALTPEQYVTYEKNKEAMKEKIRARVKEKGEQ